MDNLIAKRQGAQVKQHVDGTAAIPGSCASRPEVQVWQKSWLRTGGKRALQTTIAVMGETQVDGAVGAEHDFVALYERSVREVYSYLMSRVGDRSTAEDLTQEVFMAGVSRAVAREEIGVPWLMATARNKLVDHWRARAREDHKLGLVHSAPPPPDTELPVISDLGAADAALATLNPTYRAALVLRHVDDLSVPEVAAQLGRTVAATEQVLTRARVAFRTAYQESVS
jgi:RNA polymerase sigma-70 factor (ECF subfamily)